VCCGSDTPEVDIVGSNLYQRYVDRTSRSDRDNNSGRETADHKDFDQHGDVELPACRSVPPLAAFHRQTVDSVVPILVRTGVYQEPTNPSPPLAPCSEDGEGEEGDGGVGDERDFQGHRDLPNSAELRKPECVCDDVAAAIDYILGREEPNRK